MSHPVNRESLHTESGFADNSGVRIYYESTGSGTPIVFAHGFTLDHRMWEKQRDYFSARYRVVTFDSRGHGRSDSPVTGYSRDHRETDLGAVVDTLKLERFHLVGLSMGGATAIGYAIDFSDNLRSLTLVSAGYTGMPSRKQDALKELVKTEGVDAAKKKWMDSTLRYYADRPGYARDILETMMRDHSGAPWQDPNRGRYTHRDDLTLLKSVEVATLILVGQRDVGFIPTGRKIAEAIPGSVFEIMPHVGHMINLEAPETFNARLDKWLADNERIDCEYRK